MVNTETTKFLIEYAANLSGIEKAQRSLQELNAIHNKLSTNIPKVASILKKNVTAEMDATGQSFAKVSFLWQDIGGKMNNTVAKINSSTGEMTGAVTKGLGTFAKAGQGIMGLVTRAAMTIPIWFALRTGFIGFMSLVSGSIKSLIDWEYQMAQIRIVGTGTTLAYEQLSATLLHLATTFGISHTVLGESAKLWAQQGVAIAQIPALMESTIKLTLLTGRTMTQSVEDLTSVMKTYNFTAEQTIQITDKLEKVELLHAITTNTLIAALQKTAPVAAELGISFEKLLGIITATHVATRQTGEVIGNAWKTIFTRMSTSALDVIQNFAKIPVYIKDNGEATFETTTKLRSQSEILDELAIKWNTFSDTQKAAIKQGVAGTRQVNLFTSSMQHWNEGVDASIEALNSFGVTNKAVGIITDTTKVKIDQLGAAWTEFINTTLDTEGMKSFIDNTKLGVQHLQAWIGLLESVGEASFDASQKRAAEATKILNLEIQKQETTFRSELAIINELNILLAIRNRLMKEGNPQEVQETTNAILKFQAALSEIKGNEGFKNIGFEELSTSINKEAPKIQAALEATLSKEKYQAKIKELGDTANIQWKGISKVWGKSLAEGIFPNFATITSKEVTVLRDNLINILKSGKKKDIALSDLANAPYRVNTETIIEGLNAVLPAMEAVEKVRAKGAQQYAKEVKQEEEKNKLIPQGIEAIDRQIKLIQSKKSLGASELDVAKEELAFRESIAVSGEKDDQTKKSSLATDIEILAKKKEYDDILKNESTILDKLKTLGYSELQIEVQRLAMMKNRKALSKEIEDQEDKVNKAAISITSRLIDHEVELVRLRGATAEQLVLYKAALEASVSSQDEVINSLDTQLELEKAITGQKDKQKNLSSDTVALFKIAQKFGVTTAKDIADVLKGTKKLAELTPKESSVFKKQFSSQAEQIKAQQFFFQGEGRNINIVERPSTTQTDLSIRRQFAERVTQVGINVAPINVNIDAESIMERIKDRLLQAMDETESELSKKLNSKIENF